MTDYILKVREDAKEDAGKFVGLDHASGGYPYLTDRIASIHIWHNYDEACRYRNMFDKEWIIYELLGLNIKIAKVHNG